MEGDPAPHDDPDALEGVLDGIRVLDFTQVLAGPTATRLLVEMGAEVIKVEIPPEGDLGRVLPGVGEGRSGYHVQQNRGKRCICVDLKDPRGRELMLDLVTEVDIVAQNFGPGVMARLGLDWPTLSARNPRLIMLNISAFGTSGPLADRPGYDPIAQAFSGVLSVLGERDATPILAGVSPGDVLTGVHGAAGLCAALYHRERTGRGMEVRVALLDAYTTVHEVNIQMWSTSGGAAVPTRNGSTHPVVGGVGVFSAGDGHVVVAAVNDRQWSALCGVMGRPELAEDPQYATAVARVEHRDDTNDVIAAWMAATGDRDGAVDALVAARVPAAPVLTIAEAATHPHLVENRTVRTVPDDVLGEVTVTGMPIKFSEFPDEADLRAADLGQHNEDVVAGLLADPDRYAELTAAGVLYHRSPS